jgi:acetyl esterase/lipase
MKRAGFGLSILLLITAFAIHGHGRISASQTPAQQPEGVIVDRDVQYGEAGGQKLLLDVYTPQASGANRPVILFVHGGGWAAGDKLGFGGLASLFAKEGYVCFSANYRLVTEQGNRYPAQLDDVQRAVRWIRSKASKYGLNPRRIGAVGDSAGGHLVSLLGTRDTRNHSEKLLSGYSSRVSCVVDMYGPTDFNTGEGSISKFAAEIVYKFLGKKPNEDPGLYKEVSPVTYVNRLSAPFLIFHGTKDELVPMEQSQRIYDKLRAAGVEATLIKMQDDGHGFALPDNQKKFVLETKSFFDRHLKN